VELTIKSEPKKDKIRHTISYNNTYPVIIDEDSSGYTVNGLDIKNMGFHLDKDMLEVLGFFYNAINKVEELK
jgi:hypothetical protein